MIKINDVLNNRYKIVDVIGHGGMSDVYLAYDRVFSRNVAVKVIKSEFLNNPEALIRFENEARFSSSLKHPNIVAVYFYDKNDGVAYMVNEYIKGQTLKEYLDVRKRFPERIAVNIMIQLCDALMYIHSRNIIHRDIKPNNIFYNSDGDIKLSDFGISYLLNGTVNVHENKRVMGTAEYMAPETFSGYKPSYQTDIYAFGIMFFELLTGFVPFEADTPKEISDKVRNVPMPSPKQYVADISEEVSKVILKCCEKEASRRYRNVGEIKQELVDIYNGRNIKKKESFLRRIFICKK